MAIGELDGCDGDSDAEDRRGCGEGTELGVDRFK